jgi:polyisoprenoid-binding protein YceI
MRKRFTAAVLGAIAAVLPAAAAEIQVHLPPASTTIGFTLKATMHTVHGTASLDHADFTIDVVSGAASGEAVVVSGSADTDNQKRDKKMHSKVLLSSEHRLIAITAERIEGTLDLEGTSEVVLVGTMELIGASHPIRVPMTVTLDGDTAAVDAAFSVPYVEWGLKDPSTFVLRVGKEVPVTIHAENVSVTPIPSP